MIEKENKYLDEKETSKLTSMALSTLRNYRHLGIGVPYIKVGRAVRYSLKDILSYMESRKIKTEERR
jgi:predicted DNA-binding transcriptional regulator AlpA